MVSETGDVALVSGGARGSGLAIAERLARRGMKVGLLDAPARPPVTPGYAMSDRAGLDEAVALLTAAGATAIGVSGDVRRRADVERAAAEVESALGPISHLVVAAGVFAQRSAATMSDEDWDDVVDTNLHGFYNVARVVVPSMSERGHGRVLALCGQEGRRGVPGQTHLAAASWAVIGLAKSIAIEVAALGVAVNVLCVGPVKGAPRPAAAIPYGTDAELAAGSPNRAAWIDASTVAQAAELFLAAPDTSMTGAVLDISNGLAALNTS